MSTKKKRRVRMYDTPEPHIPKDEYLQELRKAVDSGLRGEITTPGFTQHTKVGDIGIEVVAGLATSLPSEIPPPDAIRRAYQLLIFASAARRGEVSLSGYEEGIQRLLNTQEGIAEIVEQKKKRPPNLFQKMTSDALKAPLDSVLANLMPRYVVKDRLPIFIRWMEIYIPWMRGEEQDLPTHEAESLIAKWRKDGVPKDVYLKAREEIETFLRYVKHVKFSESGKAGAVAKKKKQGSVKKKSDKRIGSRLPGEKSTKAKK